MLSMGFEWQSHVNVGSSAVTDISLCVECSLGRLHMCGDRDYTGNLCTFPEFYSASKNVLTNIVLKTKRNKPIMQQHG